MLNAKFAEDFIPFRKSPADFPEVVREFDRDLTANGYLPVAYPPSERMIQGWGNTAFMARFQMIGHRANNFFGDPNAPIITINKALEEKWAAHKLYIGTYEYKMPWLDTYICVPFALGRVSIEFCPDSTRHNERTVFLSSLDPYAAQVLQKITASGFTPLLSENSTTAPVFVNGNDYLCLYQSPALTGFLVERLYERNYKFVSMGSEPVENILRAKMSPIMELLSAPAPR